MMTSCHTSQMMVLALDFADMISLVILVVAFLGWLMSLIGEKQGPQRPPRRPQPNPGRAPRDERLRNEIDVFLEQVGGSRERGPRGEAPRRTPAGPRPREEETPIEIVEPSERQQPDHRRPQPRNRQPQARLGEGAREPRRAQAQARVQAADESAMPVQPRARPEGSATDRLGTAVRDRLTEYMQAHRLDDEVQEHLRHAVDESVGQHMGRVLQEEREQPYAPDLVERPATTAENISTLLQNRNSLRQAIVLNEILSPPKALRPRR